MKKQILIVDDDASVRQSLRKVLVDAGYDVRLAADGEAAVRQFEAGRVDLMLLDIGLPMRDGWETFEELTTKAPVLPIIIITGHANQYDIAVAAGVGALMEKPLDVPELLRVMDELLIESQETRLRRLCGYSQDTRYVLSDSARFLQQLRERRSTPLRGAAWSKLRKW